MNFWDGERWTPSDSTIETTPNGFAANRIQHKIALAQNLNGIGAVTVVTPDGLTLRSAPVGIGLYDAASGNSLIIAEVTDCSGVLVSSNKVVYENAFRGISADVSYTVDRFMLEQDIVIRERLDPADYGFDPATARIRVFTELYDAPKAERIRRPLRVEEDEQVRRRMVTPDLVDEVLGFGEFVLATGRAFATGDADAAAPVAKEIRRRTREILRSPAGYEAPRH